MSAHFQVCEIGACVAAPSENPSSDLRPIEPKVVAPTLIDPFARLGRVLTEFATAERAIGQLCLALDLSVEKGPLASLKQLCAALARSGDKRCQALLKRIERWRSFRPLRHLLAHASILVVHDAAGKRFFITRHLPLDRYDVTPDRLWTEEECQQLLKIASSDGRSIADQIRNLTQNSALMAELKKPVPGSSPG